MRRKYAARESIFTEGMAVGGWGTTGRPGWGKGAAGLEFSVGASHQISLMKWENIVEPIGAEESGIHAPPS